MENNQIGFQKAQREQIKLRIGLIGPSGTGKTYSALRIAKGLGGKTAFIDTEGGRGKYYAEEFEYDIIQLEPPFSPERYIALIKLAEMNGYDNLIIDSLSHEWIGKGGLLEEHDKMPGNSYTNWNRITPRHNTFIDTILRSSLHVIANIRGKDQYVLQDKDGKQVPKKVGMGGQMRDGFEYECTVAFMLEQDTHIAGISKDNTHLFESTFDLLTEESGKKLKAWAEEGLSKLDMAITGLNDATTADEVQTVINRNRELLTNEKFIEAGRKKKTELENAKKPKDNTEKIDGILNPDEPIDLLLPKDEPTENPLFKDFEKSLSTVKLHSSLSLVKTNLKYKSLKELPKFKELIAAKEVEIKGVAK